MFLNDAEGKNGKNAQEECSIRLIKIAVGIGRESYVMEDCASRIAIRDLFRSDRPAFDEGVVMFRSRREFSYQKEVCSEVERGKVGAPQIPRVLSSHAPHISAHRRS